MSWDRTTPQTKKLVASLSSSDGQVRHRAYQELIRIGPPALPAVHEGLHNEDWQVRRWCAMVLDRIAEPESFRRLIPLLKDPHSLVRLWAVHSISCDQCKETTNPIDVVPYLIERLRNDPSIRVRRMAAAMLANHHPDRRTIRALQRALNNEDQDPKIQLHAKFGIRRATESDLADA